MFGTRKGTPINFEQLEADITPFSTQNINDEDYEEPEGYAPPQRTPIPLPTYVQHRENVPEVGRLSAEALVLEYERAAKEIEAMGNELITLQKKMDEETQRIHEAIKTVQEVSTRYREEGKRIFERIEECALLTKDVREACDMLRRRIGDAT